MREKGSPHPLHAEATRTLLIKADRPAPVPYGTYLPDISSRARRVMAVMSSVFPSV